MLVAIVAAAATFVVVRITAQTRATAFDAQRAYGTLEEIVAIGPRVAGSPGSAQVRALIRRELESAKLKTVEHKFAARTPIGTLDMVNLVGIVEGTQPGTIVLSNHYDTKYLPDFRFVGANDGGSTTAWMLEIARVLGPQREGRTLWLVFFDGEEAFGEWSRRDGLYGSRAFVENLLLERQLDEIKAVVNVDMIGDCDLGVHIDDGAPEWLKSLVWNHADRLGYGPYFTHIALPIEDDHTPFREAGVPAINLIDFRYGGGIRDHERNWHTAYDTLDRVCPESLQIVGDVVLSLLPILDDELDRREPVGGRGAD